jgi:tetratricopeptide (TPR) repeat protein
MRVRDRLAQGYTVGLVSIAACGSMMAACGWNPSRPFDRDAPAVRQAILDLDAGDAQAAARGLEEYLSTGECKDGNIGTPDLARRADGTFDLGLSLFRMGEQYGRRFGEEETGGGASEALHAQRHAQVQCAMRVLALIDELRGAEVELRARVLYLEGNLAFLDGEYENAVSFYDRALRLTPGQGDAGDPVGRDIAWNRAIALQRIEQKKDAGSDASSDASRDGSNEAGGDADRSGGDGSSSGTPDSGGSASDGGNGAGKDASQPQPQERDAGDNRPEASTTPQPTSPNEDERMLDQLENAPTMQQEEAKRSGKKRFRGIDK